MFCKFRPSKLSSCSLDTSPLQFVVCRPFAARQLDARETVLHETFPKGRNPYAAYTKRKSGSQRCDTAAADDPDWPPYLGGSSSLCPTSPTSSTSGLLLGEAPSSTDQLEDDRYLLVATGFEDNCSVDSMDQVATNKPGLLMSPPKGEMDEGLALAYLLEAIDPLRALGDVHQPPVAKRSAPVEVEPEVAPPTLDFVVYHVDTAQLRH